MNKDTKVITKRTYVNQPGQSFEPGSSMTVPDQATPLKVLLANYTRGVIPPMRTGEYLGDVEVPDFDRMDLSEIQEYYENLNAEIDQLTKAVKKSQDAANQRVAQKTDQEPVESTQPVETQPVE